MEEKDINIEEEITENVSEANEANETNETSETSTTSDSSDTSEDNESEQSPLEKAEEEIEQLKDQYLRARAEFENYRKRTIKEKADLILNGSKSAVTALLPIVDDLERALPQMKKAEDVAAVVEGVELIYQKFLKALEGLGVKQIDTDGKDFDVDLHEAVAQVPGVPDEQKGRVIDCVEKGYTLNDHVIRHAKVAVGM